MALIGNLMWLISAVSGWYSYFWWLIAPIIVMYFYASHKTRRMAQMSKQLGGNGSRILATMGPANLGLALWTGFLNAIFFGVGYGLHLLLT